MRGFQIEFTVEASGVLTNSLKITRFDQFYIYIDI
jgi:hypothetical protein